MQEKTKRKLEEIAYGYNFDRSPEYLAKVLAQGILEHNADLVSLSLDRREDAGQSAGPTGEEPSVDLAGEFQQLYDRLDSVDEKFRKWTHEVSSQRQILEAIRSGMAGSEDLVSLRCDFQSLTKIVCGVVDRIREISDVIRSVEAAAAAKAQKAPTKKSRRVGKKKAPQKGR